MAGSGPAAVVIEPHVVPTPGPIMPNDPDVAALKQAMHEADLEDQGGQPISPPPPPPPPPAIAPAPAAPAAAPAPAQDRTLAGRIGEMSARVSSVLEENAALKGAIAVLERGWQPPGAPAAAEPPPDPIGDRLTEIQAAKEALAARLDASEITNKEFFSQIGDLDAEATELNNQVVIEAARAQQPPPAKGDGTAAVLAKVHVAGLKARHPYLAAIVGPDMDMLAHLAHSEAAQQGVTYGDDLGSLLAFREHLGRLSDKFGPLLLPNHQPAAAPAAAPNGSGAKPLTPGQTIRAAKLEMKRGAPPDPVSQGAPAQGRVVMTETQYENIPAHEAENLPKAARDALLYGP